MKNEEIICYCSNVTKAQIIKAMEQCKGQKLLAQGNTLGKYNCI